MTPPRTRTPTTRAHTERSGAARGALIAAVGRDVVRFQDLSDDFDAAAAEVLALSRPDLRCISLLLFGGPAPAEQLKQALGLSSREASAMLERLVVAGYARQVPSRGGERVELTEHARRWVETLWGPLAEEGGAMLARESTAELKVLARFMGAAIPLHERHVARLCALLATGATGATGRRSPRLRGGLSPAALRRVQLFVEANLDRDIRLPDLAARAGVSLFHFAREFRTSVGTTPRAFVESRRVERAKELLRHTELPLGQIAAEVGLGAQSRFTTVFRNHTRVTPGAYRRGVQ